jgi:ribonuclease BN (tRNA processing enzyme)
MLKQQMELSVAGTNIFVSHIHADDEHIGSMKALLKERGFEVRDSSINTMRPNQAKDPEYIKREILGPRIRWASTLVVVISPETRDSDWVTWEIEYAQQQDKRIVGVWTHGAAECDIPDALEDYADAVVGWQADRIQGAICGDINEWEHSDGTERPVRDIIRHGC